MEPLGQSQVLNYLLKLDNYFKFYLLTFEKKNDFLNKQKILNFRSICRNNSIDWQYSRYKYNKYFIEPLIGIVKIIYFLIKNDINSYN